MQTATLKIVICDDDPTILEYLELQCRRILSEQYTIHTWSTVSPQDLIHRKEPFDVVLLDMQFSDCSGVEIAQSLLEQNPSCQIIFISAFLTSVSLAYNVPHLAMILKDHLSDYLPDFLMRAAALSISARHQEVQILVKTELVTIPLSKIAAIERSGHWTYFHMVDEDPSVPLTEKIRTREKLADLLSRMALPQFHRCHISYAVNFMHVQSLQKHDFEMRIRNGRTMLIPISRYYEADCRDTFYRFLSDLSHSALK